MLDETRLTIRLPGPLAEWLRATKDKEGSTVNFEIIRSIRSRMDAETATTGESFAGAAPAVAPDSAALAGGPIHQRS